MNKRTTISLVILTVFSLLLVPRVYAAKKANQASQATSTASKTAGGDQDNKFRLKPDARFKLCLTCHADFQDKMKKPFIHTPIKQGGCVACHSPHASNYPKQLQADTSAICLTCHKTILPQGARSTHKVALEGKCVMCHDPHSSDFKYNLRASGNELCFTCHKDKADTISKDKFKHDPVEKSCVNCHSPHASATAAALLKEDVPELCKGCHQTEKPIFLRQHLNYPVADSRCTMCHNVHGSNRAGIIYDTAHPPFINRTCNLCHQSSSDPQPLALKKNGFELCRGCHSSMVNDMLSKNRLHWPVVSKRGCLNCHSPHASPQANLLKQPAKQLCGGCHADTVKRQEASPTKHPPVAEGMCTVCHNPHASDNVLLLAQSSPIDLCGQCHDWQKHQTHPVGDKVIDKRNKNLTVQCLSCHRSHGTEYLHLIPFKTVTDLCVQCHVEKAR